MKKFRFLLLFFIVLNSCILMNSTYGQNKTKYYAQEVKIPPQIDGIANDLAWDKASWGTFSYELFKDTKLPSASDFSGKYKVVWDKSQIYILVDITDDILNANDPPLSNYWVDDCVEVFIDEDYSGGRHEVASWIPVSQYGECKNCAYNAIAYHIDAVTGDAVDIGADGSPHLYNDNVDVVTKRDGTHYTWEIAIRIYSDNFVYGGVNTPEVLEADKLMGFFMAYCDNDTKSDERENFIGTQEGALDGWIDADLFGELYLQAAPTQIPEIMEADPELKIISSQSTNSLALECNKPMKEFTIYDLAGRTIYHQTLKTDTTSATIDTTCLNTGIYLISVNTTSGIVKAKIRY